MDWSLIVCPVDFSASGEAVLRRALALAQWHEAELHVLYVRPGRTRRNRLGTTSADDPFLVRLAEFISSSNPEAVAVRPVVLTGDPVKAVADYARVKSADLIVVGQNGRRGSRFWSSRVAWNPDCGHRAILVRVETEGIRVLQIGSWPAPFGITLVADVQLAARI